MRCIFRLFIFAEDYRGFLEKDLIELSSLISLEQSGKDEVQWFPSSRST
jgi:hypothetical protein